MKRLIILLTLLALIPNELKACEMADQYRLFPVAETANGLICFELDQYRRARSEFSDIYWNVYPRLVKVNVSGKTESLKKYPLIVVEDETYNEQLRQFLKKGYADVERIQNVNLSLTLKGGTFANFERKLEDRIEYRPDTIQGGAVILIGEQSFELNYPEQYLHRSANLGLDYEDSIEVTNELVKADHPFHCHQYRLGCVRTYRTSDKEYMVLTLSMGHWYFGIKNPLENPELKPAPLREFVYHEPVAHHGHSFDLVFALL